MAEGKQRKAHLISVPWDLMRRLEERGKLSAQTAGELTRQVMLCFLDGLTLPPRTVEAPPPAVRLTETMVATLPDQPAPPPPAERPFTPPLRSVPPPVSTYAPPPPVATGPAGFPDIDFDSPGSDALAAAQELLRK